MVQGCDINILEMKGPSVTKNIKVQVPTEEQKRLAQLSHIERIDNLEDSIIKQMVEITNHSYEECAMQLRGTNMDMESAITNIIEGNSEEWETTKKKVRPEKKVVPPPTESTNNTDTDITKPSQRGSRTSTRGGGGRGGRNHKEDTRSTDRPEDRSRSRPDRGDRSSYATRGTGSIRGRGGKRQLPPRMDRQRHTRDSSDTSRSREQRNGGSYRRGSGGPSRRPQSRPTETTSSEPICEPDWGESTVENGTEEWPTESSGGWGKDESTTDSWTKPSEQKKSEPETTVKPTTESWSSEQPSVESKPLVNGTSEFSELQYNSLSTISDLSQSQRKRPAYTQAFSQSMTSSLSSMLTSSSTPDFSTPTSTAFSNSFPFSQAQTSEPSNLSSDFATRHEQATNDHGSNNLLKIQEALQKGNLAPGRKISVEQLFQMHEKPSGGSLTNIEERISPSSPPTSSTSSNNSGKRSRRQQRTIPSEPVEMPPSGTIPVVMPGKTIESLDVQFGSIGFLDNTEEDEVLDCSIESKEKTPGTNRVANSSMSAPATTTKTDAATSTTPHVENSDVGSSLPGIHHVGPLRGDTSSPEPTKVVQQSTPTTGPPNLPPPSLENIRTANSLITSLPSNDEEKIKEKVQQPPQKIHQHPQSLHQQHQHHHQHHSMQVPTRTTGDYEKPTNKSLPPGVSMYPQNTSHNLRTAGMYNSNSSYENTQQQQQQQQQQHNQHTHMSYDMSRYYTNSNNFDHLSRESAGSNNFTSSSQVPHVHDHKQYSRGGLGDQQHQLQQHAQSILSTASHQSPHIGAGITSGISSTTAAPHSTGLAGTATGYPLMGHYYPIPHHAYPNNLYAPNYYHHFNPVNFAAQTQAKQATTAVPGYPGTAGATFGNSAETVPSGGSPFTGYEDYKEMYAPTTTKHPSHAIPVTTSNDYSKMMTEKSNMFSLGYMQFPNYLPQFQQSQTQPQQALMQQQRGLTQDQSRSVTGTSINPQKHYWAHR